MRFLHKKATPTLKRARGCFVFSYQILYKSYFQC